MNIHIANLSLHLRGVSPGEGPRLARLVAEGLQRADAGGAYSLDTLTIRAGAQPDEPIERLAEKIVAAVAARLGAAG